MSWIESDDCSACGKSLRFVRDMHCYRCRHSFCSNCTSHSSPLPPEHVSPVRVCDRCYAGLVNERRVLSVFPHVFVTAQLYRPTHCDYCSHFIFGLVNARHIVKRYPDLIFA